MVLPFKWSHFGTTFCIVLFISQDFGKKKNFLVILSSAKRFSKFVIAPSSCCASDGAKSSEFHGTKKRERITFSFFGSNEQIYLRVFIQLINVKATPVYTLSSTTMQVISNSAWYPCLDSPKLRSILIINEKVFASLDPVIMENNTYCKKLLIF